MLKDKMLYQDFLQQLPWALNWNSLCTESYPDEHVQLVFTPLFQFLDLNLARVANVQVVDSRAPSVSAWSNNEYDTYHSVFFCILGT